MWKGQCWIRPKAVYILSKSSPFPYSTFPVIQVNRKLALHFVYLLVFSLCHPFTLLLVIVHHSLWRTSCTPWSIFYSTPSPGTSDKAQSPSLALKPVTWPKLTFVISHQCAVGILPHLDSSESRTHSFGLTVGINLVFLLDLNLGACRAGLK